MKTDLDKLKLTCECGGLAEKTQLLWKGIAVRGWRCKKCGEELIHPLDAQRVLEISRAGKKLTVKFRKVGQSTVITVPQIITEKFHIKEGATAKWGVKGENKFVIEI